MDRIRMRTALRAIDREGGSMATGSVTSCRSASDILQNALPVQAVRSACYMSARNRDFDGLAHVRYVTGRDLTLLAITVTRPEILSPCTQYRSRTYPDLEFPLAPILGISEIPIAPLPEQRRIVEEIETQFTRLDDAVAALQRVKANLKRYRASVLKAACEGRLVPTEAELARAEGRDYEPADVLLQRILAERRAKWEADELAKMVAKGKPPKDDRWKAKYKEPQPPDTSDLPETARRVVLGDSVDQLTPSLVTLPKVPPGGRTVHSTPYVSIRRYVGRLIKMAYHH